MSDKADQLAAIAVELVTKVRDEEPADVHRWLASVVDPADWMGLAVVLACAVPDDKTWKALTAWAWVRDLAPRMPHPCGTVAALRQHQARAEPVCDDCKAADRQRKREARKVKAATSTSVDSGCPEVVHRLSTGFPPDRLLSEPSASYGSAA